MEENNNNNESNDKRYPYILHITFWAPQGGPVRILAKDDAHARELVMKMVPNAKDLTIHDCVLESQVVLEAHMDAEDAEVIEDTPGPKKESVH